MPMSTRRECPKCDGIGTARKASVVAGKPGIIVLLQCEKCAHEWEVLHDSPPLRPEAKAS